MPKKKVLIFISGPVPTAEDRALAEKLETKMFRNALQIAADERPESGVTAVAGAIPAQYRGVAGIEVIETAPEAPAPETPIIAPEDDDTQAEEPAAEEAQEAPKKRKKRKKR